jgi:hypothetical protein
MLQPKGCYISFQPCCILKQPPLAEHQPVGIIAFSQGAAATAFLLAGRPTPSLPFAVLAAGPFIGPPGTAMPAPGSIVVPSLHVVGLADQLVPPAKSLQLAALFVHPQIHEHPQGHCLPQRAADVQVFLGFVAEQLRCPVASSVAAQPPPAISASDKVTQDEEIEAMAAIFGEAFTLQEGAAPPTFAVRIEVQDVVLDVGFALPVLYPSLAGPQIHVRPVSLPPDRAGPLCTALQRHLADFARPLVGGEGFCFSLVEEAREFLLQPGAAELARAAAAANTIRTVFLATGTTGAAAVANERSVTAEEATSDVDSGDDDNDDNDDEVALATLTALAKAGLTQNWEFDAEDDALIVTSTAEAAAADQVHGVYVDRTRTGLCNFTVGLCGKPSAGKSTFFNAITNPASEEDGARMAAFPFTTIEPNVGTAFFAHAPPVVPASAGGTAASLWGFDAHGRQKLPVRIKDVGFGVCF